MGAHVLAVVGNRLAIMSTEPNDDAVAHMQGAGGEENTTGPTARFLPHMPHVVRVTVVAVDERRKTLAVCVEASVDADEADADEHTKSLTETVDEMLHHDEPLAGKKVTKRNNHVFSSTHTPFFPAPHT